MGSLESGASAAGRDPRRSSPSVASRAAVNRRRTCLQWLIGCLMTKYSYTCVACVTTVFLLIFALLQMYLPSPGSLVEEFSRGAELVERDLVSLKELGVLDFGEDIQFPPSRVLEKFQNRSAEANFSSRPLQRYGWRKPQLALVFVDLLVDPQQLLMVTLATAFREIGYEIQVYSLRDGPVGSVWKSVGVPVTIFQINNTMENAVDWLNFDGVLVNSLEAKSIISCFMQEPFKSLPLLWTIHERALAIRSREYASSGKVELINEWKKVFNRASVLVFPNHALRMIYSTFDVGNYYVIPSSPVEAWEAHTTSALPKDTTMRMMLGYEPDDIVIAIVGSEFLYRGVWLEHALVLQALLPLFLEPPIDVSSNAHFKIIVLSGDSTGNYSLAVEAIVAELKYPRGAVKHLPLDRDAGRLLSAADLVIYGSFLEEQSFPKMLMKAMCIAKPIIAPDLTMIRKHVYDKVNGYLFPKENIRALPQIILQMISRGKLSALTHSIAAIGKHSVKTLMVQETVDGYASLLAIVVKLPSEVAAPKSATEIPSKFKRAWCWHLFEPFFNSTYESRDVTTLGFLDKVEAEWNQSQKESSNSKTVVDDSISYEIWAEERRNEFLNEQKEREDEELSERSDQPHGTWDGVDRKVKRAERAKNNLHERDEEELDRTGQPLCIYEPYFGEGSWAFLHLRSLYRGVALSTRGTRPGTDDLDAPSRLPLLNNSYYRDILGDYGAFFSVASRVDGIHKNPWIGFQSWRATARKESLSRIAEKELLDAIERQRYGDALYFWSRMDMDPRYSLEEDFWSFCDAVNAGNCRFAFSEALKRMYGIKHDLDSLPPMPKDGDTWSVKLSWALPTRSFLEFVMFSRMFVDSLDAQMYDEHHQSGLCYLSLSEDKHCYSRILELLINVWAYHSARHMVYVHPETGLMQEQHNLDGRRGEMWIKWFSYTTLKSMDEELAEEADSDNNLRQRWLWPSTGEVFWQGVRDRERRERDQQKAVRKKLSNEKLARMKKRRKQEVIGKYVKPPPEQEYSNSSDLTSTLVR